MASTSKINSLKMAAEMALVKLQGKRYFAGDLSNRLQKTADEYRQDTVIQAMSRVIEKIAAKNPEQIISQAEVEKIYNELVGLNASGTRCKEVLSDIFITAEEEVANNHEEFINGLRDNPDAGVLELVSKEQPKEYESLFGEESDTYDPKLASNAKNKVGLELNSLGIDKTRVRLAGGNSRFVVFAADIDTNKGMVRVLVPADASGKQFPSVFVAGNRFETLTKANIKTYVDEAEYKIDRLPTVKSVLSSLDLLTGHIKKSFSNPEFSKLASIFPGENNSEGLSGSGLYANLPDPKNNINDIKIPLVEVPKPLKAMASEIEDGVVESSIGYPKKSIEIAKKMIVSELSSMGFKGTQVRVQEPMKDGFVCRAVLNSQGGKVTIDVPIEMNGIVPLMPSVFAHEDKIADFNAQSIKSIATVAKEVQSSVHRDYQLYSLDLHQLKDIMIKSAANGDFEACDDVLEAIAETNSPEVYRNVVADYQKMLLNIGSLKETIKQSQDDKDQFVKTSTSIYPIHKKLGRPAHELVRDENGEYHLKSTYYSRQNQEDSSAFFSNSKVLVGD